MSTPSSQSAQHRAQGWVGGRSYWRECALGSAGATNASPTAARSLTAAQPLRRRLTPGGLWSAAKLARCSSAPSFPLAFWLKCRVALARDPLCEGRLAKAGHSQCAGSDILTLAAARKPRRAHWQDVRTGNCATHWGGGACVSVCLDTGKPRSASSHLAIALPQTIALIVWPPRMHSACT